jgi:hypothetical protein
MLTVTTEGASALYPASIESKPRARNLSKVFKE